MPAVLSHSLRSIKAAYLRARGPDPGALGSLRAAVRSLATAPPHRDGAPLATVFENEIEQRIAAGRQAYGDELTALREWARMRNDSSFFPGHGMYDWIEAQALYLLIRGSKPAVVVEISPAYGYTTGFILLAMNANRSGELHSFDLDEGFHRQARRNFARAGMDPSRQRFVAGDVRRRVAEIPPAIDLLFMDSDHTAEFARWYVAELFPRVRDGGLIHVHDILQFGVKPHQGDLGEGAVIDEYVRRLPPMRYLYVSEFVRRQPLTAEPLRSLPRYPFGAASAIGTNNVEQNASLWIRAGR